MRPKMIQNTNMPFCYYVVVPIIPEIPPVNRFIPKLINKNIVISVFKFQILCFAFGHVFKFTSRCVQKREFMRMLNIANEN